MGLYKIKSSLNIDEIKYNLLKILDNSIPTINLMFIIKTKRNHNICSMLLSIRLKMIESLFKSKVN